MPAPPCDQLPLLLPPLFPADAVAVWLADPQVPHAAESVLTLLAGVELILEDAQAPHATGSVLIFTAGVLLVAGTHCDQVWPSVLVLVLVLTAGVELLAELHSDHDLAGSVLVFLADVLLAVSQLPQAVELTEVAMTGVGYPDEHVSFRGYVALLKRILTNWCTVRDADLNFAHRVNNCDRSGRCRPSTPALGGGRR